MIRRFYIWLLRLHPRRFRQRFAGEMLEIFDQAAENRSAGPLLYDAVVSLGRQWALRPEYRPTPVAASAVGPALDGVPAFYTVGSYRPRRAALINGVVLSVAVFGAVCLLIIHGGGHPALLIGSRHPRPDVLPVERSSISPADPTTEVKVKRTPDDPWREFASSYFKLILALGALDADHDFIISPSEIANASVALEKLDLNHDGKLSPEECGLYFGDQAKPDSQFVKCTALEFMRIHPVLAALDADHDGEISASEIKNSSAALKKLDRNGDGSLTADEVAPAPAFKSRSK